MWNKLDKNWQKCFELAWQSYCSNSFPIGAIVVDIDNRIISQGKSSQIKKKDIEVMISGNKLSHAEINALIQINQNEHPEINNYTLYTTMEPCPMCFGAFIMSWVRNLQYAARDRYAGAVELNVKSNYIKNKNSKITGPNIILEIVQIAIQTCFVLERSGEQAKKMIELWKIDCPIGVKIGEEFFISNELKMWKSGKNESSIIFDEIIKKSNTFSTFL
jgi:tRNA(adenine34) deaminase